MSPFQSMVPPGPWIPPIPENEAERLAALFRCEILDTAPEEAFDEITKLAAAICETPMASISLVDASRQWFKSNLGHPFSGTPREISICAHALTSEDLLLIPDTLLDERFTNNPLVTESPKIRFYAGTPLITPEGEILGALCVTDHKPRQLSELQLNALRILGKQVMTQIQLRRDFRSQKLTEEALVASEQALRTSEERWHYALTGSDLGVWDWSVQSGEVYFSPRWCTMLGHDPSEISSSVEEWTKRVHPDDLEEALREVQDHLDGRREIYISEHRLRTRDGGYRWMHDRGKVIAFDAEGKPLRMVGTHTDVTERKLVEEKLIRLNRVHALLSQVNTAIIHARTRPELFEAVCRIAVETGQIFAAWIGLVREGSEEVYPAATAGDIEGYLQQIRISVGNEPSGTGPFGTAFKENRHVICNDIENDATSAPWREIALARGYRSLAVFPLHSRDLTMGGFALHAPVAGFFDSEEVSLLSTLAANISFAIEFIDQEERRRRAEAALIASEATMAAAQSIAHFGSWELNLLAHADGGASPYLWSDEMYRIAGYAPGSVDVSDTLLHDLTHEDERDTIWNTIHEAIQNHEPYSLVHRLIRPDGETRIIQETAQIFYDEQNDQPLRIVGTAHDITEQRLSEEHLRESEQRFRQLAENIHEVFWVTDPDEGQLLYVSPAYETIWGRTCESLYRSPSSWLEAVHPEDRERTKLWSNFKQVRGEHQETYRIIREDGTQRWIHDRAYPVRNGSGRIYRIVGTAEDITERRQAEELLRKQATLLDKAQDAILVCDLDHHIHYWNQSAERLYGWTAREAIGSTARELLYRDSDEFSNAAEITLMRGEWVGEMRQLHKDGETLVIEARWTLLRDENGLPESFLTINTDITERKKLEQHFIRAQRVESIGTLAGGIAHDLNNVLAPIMMSIDLLKVHITDPKAQSILQMIATSAKRGADMVDQVLSFARGLEGRRIEVQIRHLVRDLVKIADETFPKSIRVKADLPTDLWTIKADPTQIHQVLLNLMVNSRDSMPDGGRITLRAENFMIDAQYASMNVESNPGPHVRIEVEDTGCGIAQGTVNKIFDPFFTTKQIGKGTGLGLSTALAIVRSHGGFIQVYSEVGQGSRFRIYMPAIEGSELMPLCLVEPSLPKGHGETVLLVDDEAAILKITKQTLETFGYRVLLAPNGAEAVSVYVENRDQIDVVLTDMIMPLMDGPSLIRILRRLNPGIRIIAASGMAANGLVVESAQEGVKHFLAKPYTAETLLTTLRSILDEDLRRN